MQREREYVEAVRALGATERRIIFRTILPNILTPLIVIASFNVAGVILAEASLSFLGLGVPESVPTWGAMLADSRNQLLRRLLVAGGLPRHCHHVDGRIIEYSRRLDARLSGSTPARFGTRIVTGEIMSKLQGKTAIVTGAAQGLGYAIAKAYVKEGMRVAMMDIRSDLLETIAGEFTAMGGDVVPITVDLSDAAQTQAAVDTAALAQLTAHPAS